MTEVRIERAALESAIDLARLKWLDAEGCEPTDPELRAFTQEMTSWWAENGANHSAYIARSPSGQAIGAAWLALVPRVPRPGNLRRLSADVQSVYVVPTSRGQGVGSMLVEAARAAAVDQGAPRIVVHSSERAVPLYRRLGFAISERLLQRHHDS